MREASQRAPELPPPNSRFCERKGCHARAAGFVIFEAKIRGITNVLPFEWRCLAHANLRAEPNWVELSAKMKGDFERRAKGDKIDEGRVIAGISTFSEEEADELIFFATGALPSLGGVDVEHVKPRDLRDAFGDPGRDPFGRKL